MGPNATTDSKILIKETIKELLSDEDFIDKFLNKVTEKIDFLQKMVNQQQNVINQLEGKIESIRQNEKINNVCIYGIEEEDNERTDEKIMDLINQKLSLPFKRDDIIKSYRIGANKKPRPIVVKFSSYHLKAKILQKRSGLKGTKVVIMEELTKSRLELYKLTQEKVDRKMIFTRDGNIYLKQDNGRPQKIRDINDLNKYGSA